MNQIQPSLLLEFKAQLRRWTWYYRLRRSIAGSLHGLIFALAGTLGFCLIAVFSGTGLRYGWGLTEFLSLMLLAVGCGIITAGSGAFLWPIKPFRVARLVDAAYGLQERFSTAEELVKKQSNFDIVMADHLLADAIQSSHATKPEASFYLHISRNQLLSATGLALGAILIMVFGQPYFQQAAEQKLIRRAIQNEITRLEELQEMIENNPSLSPEDQIELTEKLQETTRKLEQTESLEQAVAALAESEQELRALDNAQTQEQAQALRQLGNQILQNEDNASNPLEEFGQALANDDPLAAAQALQNMDIESMSAEEQQALAQQLSQASKAVQNTNPQLAQQLSQASQALKSNDTAQAQQALDQAANELSQTGSQIAQAGAIQEAAAQVGEGTERLIQAGRNSQQAQANPAIVQSGESGVGQGNGQGSSPENGQGSGQTDGQGSSSQPNNNPGGSGAGKGSTDQGNASSAQAGDEPIDQGNGPGDGGERPFVPLNDAQRLGGTGSTDVYLPDSGVPGEDVTGLGNTSPEETGGSTVPYVQIYPAYADAYRQAIESGVVPPALRNLVQKYFSNLEP